MALPMMRVRGVGCAHPVDPLLGVVDAPPYGARWGPRWSRSVMPAARMWTSPLERGELVSSSGSACGADTVLDACGAAGRWLPRRGPGEFCFTVIEHLEFEL